MKPFYQFIIVCRTAIVILLLAAAAYSQTDEMVRRTKQTYERTHPGERTYLIQELVKALDSADAIMPNAKALTYERRSQIGGAFFGSSLSWKTSNLPKRTDGFTDVYFRNDSFKQLISENLQTDALLFDKFMLEHKAGGFYKVTIWQPGYLMFFMLEGRQTHKGLMFVVVPVKKQVFDQTKRFGAGNP